VGKILYALWHRQIDDANVPEAINILRILVLESLSNDSNKALCAFAVATLPDDHGTFLSSPFLGTKNQNLQET
jgi:hypothetical protein